VSKVLIIGLFLAKRRFAYELINRNLDNTPQFIGSAGRDSARTIRLLHVLPVRKGAFGREKRNPTVDSSLLHLDTKARPQIVLRHWRCHPDHVADCVGIPARPAPPAITHQEDKAINPQAVRKFKQEGQARDWLCIRIGINSIRIKLARLQFFHHCFSWTSCCPRRDFEAYCLVPKTRKPRKCGAFVL
jgi:hypothetical protein